MFDVVLALVLLVMGYFVLLLEFAIPSFGLLTVLALVLLGFGLITLAGIVDTWVVVVVGGGSFLAFIVLVRFLMKSKLLSRLGIVLDEKIRGGSSTVAVRGDLAGKRGVATTTLRPSGVALIGGKRYDVVTDGGEYLEAGAQIVVVRISTNSIVVEQVTDKEGGE